MPRPSRWRPAAEDGAQAVEFALILTPLLLIIVGIINFGYLFGQKLALNQAVREGARLTVVDNTATTSPKVIANVRGAIGGLITPDLVTPITSDIQSWTLSSGFGSFSTTGTKTCRNYTDDFATAKDKPGLGGQLRVRAEYQPDSWLIPIPLPIGVPKLEAEAVFRCEVLGA